MSRASAIRGGASASPSASAVAAAATPSPASASARGPATAAALLQQYSPGKKILKAHSGGGGGVLPQRSSPIRRSGPPGTHNTGRSARAAAAASRGSGSGSPAAGFSPGSTGAGSVQAHGSGGSAENDDDSGGGDGQSLALAAVGPSPDASANDPNPLMTDKQSLCIDILVAGHVNSFVDFFYLTHRAEEDSGAAAAGGAAGAGAGTGGLGSSGSGSGIGGGSGSGSVAPAHPPAIPDGKLHQIQRHLTTAEKAHRRGDSDQVYSCYEALANDFHAAKDYKTSLYYYEKCLLAGTLVATADRGPVPVEQIKKGDQLVGEGSRIVLAAADAKLRVVHPPPAGEAGFDRANVEEELYEVTTPFGDYTVTGDHRLTVHWAAGAAPTPRLVPDPLDGEEYSAVQIRFWTVDGAGTLTEHKATMPAECSDAKPKSKADAVLAAAAAVSLSSGQPSERAEGEEEEEEEGEDGPDEPAASLASGAGPAATGFEANSGAPVRGTKAAIIAAAKLRQQELMASATDRAIANGTLVDVSAKSLFTNAKRLRIGQKVGDCIGVAWTLLPGAAGAEAISGPAAGSLLQGSGSPEVPTAAVPAADGEKQTKDPLPRMAIKQVAVVAPTSTYSIAVEGLTDADRRFALANGVLTHNCLDLAESMADLPQQCNSYLNLGLTYDAMGDTAAAIRFHEKHRAIAEAMGAAARVHTANQQLVEAYRRYAEEHERRDDHATAVLLYKRCLQAAQDANDMRSEGLATYRLGVACAALGERNDSIDYQQKYLHICKRIGDQLGEGAACAALAHSFKEMGQTELAVSYLEKYQAIAQRNKQSVAQAEACAALGSIHSAGGDHHLAVNFFEKTFDIARTVGDRTLIDSARINLGMARGNMAMSKYMGIVNDNLPALLNWKTRRQQFKQTAVRGRRS